MANTQVTTDGYNDLKSVCVLKRIEKPVHLKHT